jgi:hypothetical protein
VVAALIVASCDCIAVGAAEAGVASPVSRPVRSAVIETRAIL